MEEMGGQQQQVDPHSLPPMTMTPAQQAAMVALQGGNPFQQNVMLVYHHPQLLPNGQMMPGFYQQILLVQNPDQAGAHHHDSAGCYHQETDSANIVNSNDSTEEKPARPSLRTKKQINKSKKNKE